MLLTSSCIHRPFLSPTSYAAQRHASSAGNCPSLACRHRQQRSTVSTARKRCRTQCANSSEQQASTSGRQDTQQTLSHSDRYMRGQKGMPYKLISTLAIGGTALTAYLALSKLSGAPVVCLASGGCGSVLNSEYATVFGIPLSLLGLGAYSAVTALAIKGSLSQSSKDPVIRYGVLAGGAVLASCSASLL